MRGPRAARCAVVLALAAAVTGCSGDGAPPPPLEPAEPAPAPGSGLFVGTGPGGLGVTLDLVGEDPVTDAVDAALRAGGGVPGEGPVVGVASVVNQGPRAAPAPAFIATFDDGGAVPMPDAAGVLEGADGPAARRARDLLGTPPRSIRAGGAATLYVVLRGAPPGEVAAVRMVTVPGRPVTLRARPR